MEDMHRKIISSQNVGFTGLLDFLKQPVMYMYSVARYVSRKVRFNKPHEMRIEDYLHSDVMKPQGHAAS